MKEICGYLGLDGQFYKTRLECEKADLAFKISNVENLFDKFHNRLQYIFDDIKSKDNGHNSFEINRVEKYAIEAVCKHILNNEKMFLEILAQKKELKDTLDQLEKQLEYKNKWWIKYKWW